MSSIASNSPRSNSGRKRSLPPTDDRPQVTRTPAHAQADAHADAAQARRSTRDESPPWWEQDRRSSTRDVNDRDRDRDRDRGRRGDYDDGRHRRSYDRSSRDDYRGSDRYDDRQHSTGASAGPGARAGARVQDERYRPSAFHSGNSRPSAGSSSSYRQGDRERDRAAGYGNGNRHGSGGRYPPPPHSRDDPDILNYSDEPPQRNAASARAVTTTAPSVIPSTFSSADASTPATSTPEASAPATTNGAEAEIELEIPTPVDPEAIVAERRRRRAEILAKYSNANNSNATSAVSTPAAERVSTPEVGEVDERESKRAKLDTASPAPGVMPMVPAEDDNFDLFKDADADAAARAAEQDASTHVEGEEEISAADYNPDEDRKNDDRRRAERGGLNAQEQHPRMEEVKAVDMTQIGDDDEDDDEDDMFAIGTKPPKPHVEKKKEDGDKPAFVPVIHREFDEAAGGLADNFDDADGYYKLILGELLDNGRYHVHANLGRGMFSSVVRAKDTESPSGEDVAIKIVRSQESMFKAGLKEAQILRKLQDADPDDKKHLIRLLRTFEHRGHLCLVFESLSMNLREVVKRFGKDVGINLRAVRAYASQMFLALALLKKCDIMHADIKPDNILVNESKSMLKVCDLGSASDVSENDITPYLVSRFYRAPEIILGMPYDCSLDTWSIACTLYELYTGKILFPGRTNNHMLLLIMELKGKFPHKHLKKGRFTDQHFDSSLNFISVERNGESLKTIALSSKPAHDLRSRLMPASVTKKLKEDELRLLGHFVDLLDKMLSLEPSKRPMPKDLLSHPFIRG